MEVLLLIMAMMVDSDDESDMEVLLFLVIMVENDIEVLPLLLIR